MASGGNRLDHRMMVTESRPSEVLAALHRSADAQREYLFASRDARPEDLILVAWDGGEAVGYIAVSDEPGGGLSVWEHVVVPDHRARGIGRRLLEEAVRRARPGAEVEIDPMAQLDQQRIADYYGRLGFGEPSTRGGLRAGADEVLRLAADRHRGSAEADTPVSAIIDAKAGGVVTVPRTAAVRQAVAALSRHRIGAVVVSDDGVRVQGILSERDVVVGLDERGPAFLDRAVGEVCTPDVVTCAVGDLLSEVMERMSGLRIRHVPVTSLDRLVGIVSIGDFVHRRLGVLAATGAAPII